MRIQPERLTYLLLAPEISEDWFKGLCLALETTPETWEQDRPVRLTARELSRRMRDNVAQRARRSLTGKSLMKAGWK
jgi:hypothetical protein